MTRLLIGLLALTSITSAFADEYTGDVTSASTRAVSEKSPSNCVAKIAMAMLVENKFDVTQVIVKPKWVETLTELKATSGETEFLVTASIKDKDGMVFQAEGRLSVDLIQDIDPIYGKWERTHCYTEIPITHGMYWGTQVADIEIKSSASGLSLLDEPFVH